jgi:hypothetical protein
MKTRSFAFITTCTTLCIISIVGYLLAEYRLSDHLAREDTFSEQLDEDIPPKSTLPNSTEFETHSTDNAADASRQPLKEPTEEPDSNLDTAINNFAEASAQEQEQSSHQASNFDTPLPNEISPRVLAIFEETQKRMLQGQWEDALNEMNALYSEIDSLNSLEQSTLLNFYTNALLANEMFDEAITAFSMMLEIPDTPDKQRDRAILSLGQLYAAGGDKEAAIYHFEAWLERVDRDEESAERIARTEAQLAQLRN